MPRVLEPTVIIVEPDAATLREFTKQEVERQLAELKRAHSSRTRDAMKHKRRRGEFIGGKPPYGMRVGADGKLEPVEHEQAVLRMAAEFRATGLSLRGIAAQLDDAGIRSRAGKRFDANQIKRILHIARNNAD